ncbi:MAG: hypothetical protein RQ731_01030 [Anaerosomatales bacterium]|nr:hypothetical protein [Anaerosomatales bacterium]MDT8433337.1 hypothetical protein [Anaerosomatales bacterium]
MGRIIGAASEFYRLRLTRYDATDEPDFEWRDDILYRSQPTESVEERVEWAVEAVTLDENESVTELGRFDTADGAHELMESAEEDLQELTKSGFEERYLTQA